MEDRKAYDTLSEAINDLIKNGYTIDFSISELDDCIVCKRTSLQLAEDEFEIDEVFRFEGMNDPGDSSILYAISSSKHHVKGLLVNAYGVYASDKAAKIVEKLHKHKEL